MKSYSGLICFVVGFILAMSVSAKELPSGIEVSLDVSQSAFNSPEDVELILSLHNITNSDISFETYGTIADVGLVEDFLRVIDSGGNEMPFAHLHIKRLTSALKRTLVIAAGQTFRKRVNISSYYAIVDAGSYQVSLTENSDLSIKGNAVQVSILGAVANISLKQTFAYRSCSAAQINQLDIAADNAQILARTAYLDLLNTPIEKRSTAARYKQWFGAYSSSNYQTVQQNFSEIDNALTNQQISYDCACRDFSDGDADSIYAYVFPNNPYVVNLCPPFFSFAQQTGTDTKAGIIVHELSHFDIVAETDDEVYGPDASSALARSNPSRALNNADNHEYFAENNPKLRMSSGDISSCTVSDTGEVSDVDQPATVSFAGNSLSQAVDDTQRGYFTGSPAFFSQGSVAISGGDAAQSGNVGNSQSSVMSTRNYGSGSVSFSWRVSSEQNYDYLIFGILNTEGDVVYSTGISGSTGWQTVNRSIPNGTHDLVWLFSKDGSVSSGSDAGWVDRVQITESSSAFRSSDRNVTEITCEANKARFIVPIYNLLLDEDD